MIDINSYINELINRNFNTDKGIYYFIDLIKEKYPFFKINEDNLKTLSIVEMTPEYFRKTGFVGEYVAGRNEIKILKESVFTEFGISFSEKEIIETFLHELLHALTSKIDNENGLILEGLNIRKIIDNSSSYFLATNEGVTQYLVNDLLGIDNSDAYIFETNIAKQISLIVSKEFLIKCYSNNDIETFLNQLKALDKDINLISFFQIIYAISDILKNSSLNNEDLVYVKLIQEQLIKLYLNSDRINDTEFASLILIKELSELITQSTKQK